MHVPSRWGAHAWGPASRIPTLRPPNPRRRCALYLAAMVAAAALPLRAEAEPAPAQKQKKSGYSRYEQESLDAALAKLNGVIDPNPEGKILEAYEIVTLKVFEPRDFIPRIFLGFVNFWHVTTRKEVIEREVLLPPGARYEKELVDETARNLRALPQLSLVLCVPIQGSAPGKVKLLVITKDVWSLRLN